jgi:adenine/guanine phosphoribosyltransferase-like PRPP-binding protein
MIENKIKSVIQSIPDFPKVGIDFKDIMPISKMQIYAPKLLLNFAIN